MNFKKHFELAWNLTLKNIMSLIIMTLVYLVVSGLTLGILAPVLTAGYMQSLLQLVRTRREPKVQDLFSHMNLFLPLFAFGLAVFILILLGSLLILPGILIALFISYSMIFMIPLMTDKGMGLVDAVKASFNISIDKAHAMDHAIMVVIYLALIWVGGLVVVGTLFTCPLATLFLLSIYEERV